MKYNQIRFRSESLLSHGQGPYRAISLRRGRHGNGVRISHGAYAFNRPRFKPHFERYRLTATHFGVGAFTISIIHGHTFWNASKWIPLTPGWKYRRAQRVG